jgi:hypothetical protein
MLSSRTCVALTALAVISASAAAQPVNTTLPPGWTWQAAGTGTYDTGLLGTKKGGFNGQTTPPFNDTSFGVMDETGAPWFDGSDLSAQQYVQKQIFGNFGTSSPPGPSGFRFYNFGYQMTAAGSNFPDLAVESRAVTVNHWSNPLPDAGGVATAGQVVNVPTAATFTGGIGFGADELLIKAIGGINANTTRVRASLVVFTDWSTPFASIINSDNSVIHTAETSFNDPGAAFGSYDLPYGYGVGLGPGQINITRTGQVIDQSLNVGTPGQGTATNSVGVGFVDSYNVLPAILQDGSSFVVTYNGRAIPSISRIFGNADARISAGPGLEGNARLVVEWQAWRATAPATCLGDHDQNGVVNFADITFALANFGNPFNFSAITETLANFGANCS